MSWRGLSTRSLIPTYTCRRSALESQSSGVSHQVEPMLGSHPLGVENISSNHQQVYEFLSHQASTRNLNCVTQPLTSTTNCHLTQSPTECHLPASNYWSSQQRLEFNWLVYQDLCARRFYFNQRLSATGGLYNMRESGEAADTALCLPTEQDMKLPGNINTSDENSSLVRPQEINKCSSVTDTLLTTVPAALSKHREQLGVGLPSETSKLLKDILQQKDRELRENNNSLKGLMVNGREASDNSDLFAHLLKNNPSHARTALLEERDSLRVSIRTDSESDSDRESFNGGFNEEEGMGETDTMDSDMKEGPCEDIKGNSDNFDANSQNDREEDSMQAKRARVENIITSMRPSPSGLGADMNSQLSPDMRRPKRKQYQPQQHDSKYAPHSASKYRKQEERNQLKKQLKFVQKTLQQMQKQYMDLFDEEEKETAESFIQTSKDCKYLDILSNKFCGKKDDSSPCRNLSFSPNELDSGSLFKEAARSVLSQDISSTSKNSENLGKESFKDFASVLKYEIADAVGSAIDGVVTKFLNPSSKVKKTDNPDTVSQQSSEKENKPVTPPPTASLPRSPGIAEATRKETHTLPKPTKVSERNDRQDKYEKPEHKTTFLESPLRGYMDLPRSHHLPHLPAYPNMPFYMPTQVHAPTPLMFGVEPEQTEALPLVVNTPKKKRTKVTDTRLSPRAARVLLQENVPVSSHNDFSLGRSSPSAYPHLFPMLPTSVAIPNPSLQQSDIIRFYEEQVYNHCHGNSPQSTTHSPLHADQGSPGASHMTSSEGAHLSNGKRERDSYSPGDGSYDSFHMTSTLTPMHLRKAKLMFFFVRYPSSAILKMYFPDIKFNKNNTAQLVKWFSNFREFYYIQMEKYSRQAIAEGVKNADDLVVTTDSELYRILNLHYNRNNQLEVPESFRLVVQATLREFFKSIYTSKDQEQSWKKAIYKIIARMDDVLPEYFKSPNWMEQLGEM